MFISSIRGHITLESAGLIALADLSTVAVRTALTGTSDALVLAPGMHQQQSAVNINDGEVPLAGSIITEYVFRVENPAIVNYIYHHNAHHFYCDASDAEKSSYPYLIG
ncbi:hypothetical protein ARMGADRAFT_1090868 [Armillaria gallica]|uniref:Uncharacterized protein n=1 Tax=Armillaria gallica TaxID=47427 RepID=A0A2H3CRG7_ARMGA|nr:hypothetical protein ARMGADRAFT_1090868 [Armillaria gallica]